MRRFVRSDGWVSVAVGVVASLIMWLVHANLGEAYIIVFVLGLIGAVILIWPERAQLRREMRGRHLPWRPRR
jgi:uncharacterized membrane protein YeaQ/YmgE (transglycosylase-associated protein family)